MQKLVDEDVAERCGLQVKQTAVADIPVEMIEPPNVLCVKLDKVTNRASSHRRGNGYLCYPVQHSQISRRTLLCRMGSLP